MDEQVLRSLIKWPSVPDCFGWLALDRRGQWRMRDEYAQRNQLAGNVIQHVALNEFISRNYACDTLGRYFFQNGPQRVFITLDATPWIARIIPSDSGPQLLTQCGTAITPHLALSDEMGNIYIAGLISQPTEQNVASHVFTNQESVSVALLHDHDLDLFSEHSKIHEDACSFRGTWKWYEKELPIEPIYSSELSERFHFIKKPSN
ncbi:DUF2946 family protein [Polynucleobacter sp. AP-Nino-20-G2]|uniref:DUF2946 family protein n=1 Tax=Polynucleobacter sp. AP-Nino-20-G2 TaxID=2576917 RepID=UPI001BFD3466|nr:DUF2946 family protein [Polynucleobacter sp. AP-Nino-20-G2]QWE16431.1 DUF2946 family protein [Polynucleobacter sp. AP-Nino-20-G2]